MCELRSPHVALSFYEQNISKLTTWELRSQAHIAVVHLGGAIHRLETELEGAGALHHPPMSGEVWVVPAEAHYASIAHGGQVRYAELHLDPGGIGLDVRAIRARAGHYDAHMHRTVERVYQLTTESDDLARMEAEALSRALYVYFFREYSQSVNKEPRTPRLTGPQRKRLERYVDENLGARIVLKDLAGLAGLTVHELLPAFRAAFGATPAQYVIDQRLRRARHLLAHSSADLTRIAMETGFSSHAHFSTQFKSRTGLTPREFRCAAGGLTSIR